MSLEEEVSRKMNDDPRWGELPYEYAYLSICAGLTFAQAWSGFINRESPEKAMFRDLDFSEEQIRYYNTL